MSKLGAHYKQRLYARAIVHQFIRLALDLELSDPAPDGRPPHR